MSENFDELQQALSGWRAKLLLTQTKQPRPLLANALIALRRATGVAGRARL
jgi:hypothetical protein